MGKLTEYIDKKREEEENLIVHNILTNESAFQAFIENIEDLDFSSELIAIGNDGIHGIYDLRVLLDESAIKYSNSSQYPYKIRVDTAEKELFMHPHRKSYRGNTTVENLDTWLNENLPASKLKKEDVSDEVNLIQDLKKVLKK